MTDTNATPIFTFGPYEVFVRADKEGYCVLNSEHGVFEKECEKSLGAAISYASNSKSFLEEVEEHVKEEPVVSVYSADVLKAH